LVIGRTGELVVEALESGAQRFDDLVRQGLIGPDLTHRGPVGAQSDLLGRLPFLLRLVIDAESVDHGGEGQAREDEGDEQDDDGRDDDGRPSGEGFAGGGGRRNGQGQGDRREPAHPAPGHERGVADIQRSGIGVLLAAPAFEEGAQQQPGEADGDDDCGDDEPHAGGSAEVRVLGFDDHAQIEPDESEGDAVMSISRTCQVEFWVTRSAELPSTSRRRTSRAATTPAMTPLAWKCSAMAEAPKGSMSMREERVIVWSIFSITDQTMKTTMRPIATATTAEMRKDRISSVKSTSVPDRVAAIAVWKITREAASLNSPSLCRVELIRRGIDTVPATASTATGSGGASIAPSAIAAEMVIPGMRSRADPATAAAVTPTRATAMPRIVRQRMAKSAHEVFWAAAKSSGGRNSGRMSSGSMVM